MVKSKKKFFILTLVLVSLGAGAWEVKTEYPLEVADLLNRAQLLRSSVQEVDANGLHGYLHDFCEPGVQPWENCACVALVHGLGDSAMTWKKLLVAQHKDWEEKGLQRTLRVLAVDLPGAGGSPVPNDSTQYRVRRQAEKLKLSLRTICPSWVVVGHSLGGAVAMWLALDYPEIVTRLILVDSAGLKSSYANAKRSPLSQPTVQALKEFQKKAYFRPRPIAETVWPKIVEQIRSGHSADILRAQIQEEELDLRMPSLHPPTLILWGQADQILPISIGQEMRSLLKTVIWREVPECGHLPQKECPLPLMQSIIDMIQLGAA